MKLTVTLEHRFTRTPDGCVWSRTAYTRPFWDRYLAVFEGVRIVARAESVEEVDSSYKRVDEDALVEFLPVPYYVGPWQYLRSRHRVRQALHAALGDGGALLCRVPSQLANDLLPVCCKQGRPFGLVVVGDPEAAFAPGAVRHPLRPFLRRFTTHHLKVQCASAAAVRYVTEQTLQNKYRAGAYQVSISDVEIGDAFLRGNPRGFRATQEPEGSLVFVGSLAQMYKAPDVLIRAMQIVLRLIRPVRLKIIGEGRHRPGLQQLVRKLQLASSIEFTGELPRAAIQNELDKATLFVLPSRTEGLPRALIEAMARALPCIGSSAGGIPELLGSEDMFPPGNAEALAAKIVEVLADPARLTRMSATNLRRAADFRPEVLNPRRTEFYAYLRLATERWLRNRKHAPGQLPVPCGSCT